MANPTDEREHDIFRMYRLALEMVAANPEVLARVQAEIARLSDDLRVLLPRCIWKEDSESDKWDTECGKAFVFIEDGPAENGVKFCCYCSMEVLVQREGGV